MTYQEKLKDPQWIKKRETLLSERGEICQSCGETKELTIHHGYYRPKGDPWDYEEGSLWVLCWPCHERLQVSLTEIHQIVGHINPKSYGKFKEVLGKSIDGFEVGITKNEIDDSIHEYQFGITVGELAEILKEEKDAERAIYSAYSVSIISSSELGPTIAYELEEAVCQRFPGIGTGVYEAGGERDGIVSVEGPDAEIASMIEAWCHKRSGQY
ncbi:MAG: HNH endonuclease [Verrucomicrobiales bacterium]|nr:hypothetical protein [Verrucomicrobiae bacterium]